MNFDQILLMTLSIHHLAADPVKSFIVNIPHFNFLNWSINQPLLLFMTSLKMLKMLLELNR